MNESRLQKKIRDKLNDRPSTYCVKMHGGPHQARGLPDLVGVTEGLFFGLEVKMPGKEGNLTEIQQKKLNDIDAAGGITAVVTTVEEANEALDDGLI